MGGMVTILARFKDDTEHLSIRVIHYLIMLMTYIPF